MYDNISSLRFQKGSNNETLATAMISAEGEVMDFRTHIPAEGRVEDWMTNILEEMRITNRLITKEAVFFYCENKTRWGMQTLCFCNFVYVLFRISRFIDIFTWFWRQNIFCFEIYGFKLMKILTLKISVNRKWKIISCYIKVRFENDVSTYL